jgi:ABC-type amino acid transport substrate-binding protein
MRKLSLLIVPLLVQASTFFVSVRGQAVNSSLVRPALFGSGYDLYPIINITSSNSNDWNGLDVDIVRYVCNLTSSYSAVGAPEISSSFLDCVPLDQVYIASTLDDRIDAVVRGDADFSIGAISATAERENVVNFIRPFYFAVGSIMLGDPKSTSVSSWEDLKGKRFCMYEGYHAGEKLKDAYGAAGIVTVSSPQEAERLVYNNTCSVFVIDDQSRHDGSTLKEINAGVSDVGAVPYGIAVSKNASDELVQNLVAASVSLMWNGTGSALWGFLNDTVYSEEYFEAYGGRYSTGVEYTTGAITGFLTDNGNALDFSTMPINAGDSLSIPPASTPAPYNATIVVYRGNSLPLARIDGDKTFLDDGSEWEGMEISMLSVICGSSVIECTNVLIAETVDERLDLLQANPSSISVGSIVVNQERVNQAAFIQPFYFSAGPALYMPSNGTIPENITLDYMDGKNVCTVTGSAQNPAGESYGAILVEFDTRAQAEAAVYRGDCIGLLWVSHISFDGLVEVATDISKDDPIGIAVSTDLPLGAYSFISSLVAGFMSNGTDSDLIQWEKKYLGSASPNKVLVGVSDAITNFSPSVSENLNQDHGPSSNQQPAEPTLDTSGGSFEYTIYIITHIICIYLYFM